MASVVLVTRSVSFIPPDLAITAVDQIRLDDHGHPTVGDPRGRPTYTWRRSATGQWVMVAGQNASAADD